MAFADYNLGGLRTRVKFRLQNVPKFTSAMVDLALNKAVVRLLLFIRNTTTIYTASTFVLTDGPDIGKYAMEYPLPDNTLYVDSLSFDGQRPLKVLDQRELVNAGGSNNTSTGDPYGVYIYDTPERTKVAVLFPRPNRTATLEFYGGVEPTPMAADGDMPPFREDASDALEAYAVAYLLDGQVGEEEKALLFFKKWQEEREEAKFNQRVDRIWRTRRTRDIS